ncbi:hypothetical protein JDV02_009874 [Purpureocillium takamizusanense]|uniref:Uncharacterized protein n=1 Tax=Purpureocillium takamizusanense TaxID=2060973 RepID=A0A9Q8QQY7_9HYPO|nr:uncharacterized protein JDV02_009874 [Purpureocillium takamizusanense]UNI24098.1 hypothetical protein JDV02_009874 [Purpureocillium takamizusanense]
MAPIPFHLEPKSFTPPTKTRPMRIIFVSGSGRKSNPIFPATFLRLSYRFADVKLCNEDDDDEDDSGVEVFSPDVIVPREMMLVERYDDDDSNNSNNDDDDINDNNNQDGGSDDDNDSSSRDSRRGGGPSPLALYAIEVPRDHIPHVPSCKPEDAHADVTLYAWRQDRYLGQWAVGRIKGLGHGAKKVTVVRRQAQAQAQQKQQKQQGRRPSSDEGEWERV